MNEISGIALKLMEGFLLGVIFFGGLWLTVKKAMASPFAGLLFVASFIIRVAIVLAGFYFFTHGQWKDLLWCLGGFLIARQSVIYLTQQKDRRQLQIKTGEQHAP